MKSRELYSIIVAIIIVLIVVRMLEGDWQMVSALLIALMPFLQDLHRKINEAENDRSTDN